MRVKNSYEFHYEVNEDQNMVVCCAKLTRMDKKVKDAVAAARYLSFNLSGNMTIIPSWKDNFTFKGICKLKDGDENDLDFAMKIARAKAMRQANAIMVQLLREVETVIEKYHDYNCRLQFGTAIKQREYNRKICRMTRLKSKFEVSSTTLEDIVP